MVCSMLMCDDVHVAKMVLLHDAVDAAAEGWYERSLYFAHKINSMEIEFPALPDDGRLDRN